MNIQICRAVVVAGLTSATLTGCFGSDAADGFPSIQMQEAKALLAALNHDGPRTIAAAQAAVRDREYPVAPTPAGALLDVATVDERDVEGFKVLTLSPKTDASTLRLLYVHGGAYVAEALPNHFDLLAGLIARTGATVTMPLYPLAPEHEHEEGLAFVDGIYRDLLADGPADTIVVAGDSAGGGLVLSQLLTWRDEGLDLPARAVLLSPWLDITMSHPDVEALQAMDPLLVAGALQGYGQLWAGDLDPRDPLVSPGFGTFEDLPPLQIFVGTDELFDADCRDLADTIGADRIRVLDPDTELPSPRTSDNSFFEYPGSFHVFAAATFTPESQDAMDRIATFMQE